MSYPIIFPIHNCPPEASVPPEQRALLPTSAGAIQTKKYATSVDERNFLTVYEYSVNSQWIIWDYYTGYVHFTGIWKAIGNSKADIVKLIDNSPELEPDIRRVRGGFLKIQGTWLPFPIARRLASRTCYHIRYALVPLFGPDFPESCLQPHEPGFGQLQMTLVDPTRRRRRRSTVSRSSLASGAAASPVAQGHASHPGPRVSKPRHRHSYSTGNIGGSSAAATPPYTRAPPISQDTYGRGPYQNSQLAAYLSTHEQAIVDSSHSDDDGPTHVPTTRPHRRHTIEPHFLVEPPRLPPRIAFSGDSIVEHHPHELLQVLQATRSLQQLSAGPAGRRWSTNRRSFGGGFECGGRLWKWDGQEDLSIVGPTPVLSSSSSRGSAPNSPHSLASPISTHSTLTRKSEQRRSFTGATPRVLPGSLPWSPPSSPPVRVQQPTSANPQMVHSATQQVMNINRFLS